MNEGYDLEPGAEQPTESPSVGTVQPGVHCIQCGYDLSGLPADGVCPECGLPIERSLRSNMLIDASPEYVRKLARGLSLVLNGILLYVLMFIVLFIGIGVLFAALAGGAGGGGGGGGAAAGFGVTGLVTILVMVVSLAALVMVLGGWWLFSEHDPMYTGRDDGSKSRTVVRQSLSVYIVLILAGFLLQSVSLFGVLLPGQLILQLAMSVLQLATLAVFFIASMLYVRWLAPRVPNQKAFKRAKTLLWLGPILCTVGALACYIGPLVALVLYWNMLHWLRLDIRKIVAEQDGMPQTA
ncbi:MAG: hypothetical protein AAFX05_14905 [Planctomycetota bacterium]